MIFFRVREVYGRAIFANHISRCFVGRSDWQTLRFKPRLDGDLNVDLRMGKSSAYMDTRNHFTIATRSRIKRKLTWSIDVI